MTVITTGVASPAPLTARQEIRTMFQDRELFDLYLLGLNRFQNAPATDPLSYYQVAGIHGRCVSNISLTNPYTDINSTVPMLHGTMSRVMARAMVERAATAFTALTCSLLGESRHRLSLLSVSHHRYRT
jgi:hypothetical protein